ncbi:hypothetical protein TRFO_14821 [Tritrichomonas foetus]|uniref:Uncharacterized protein n=1 Tax=Tritrichomonas foetus TaxID=1144522 RepID=A0A1J4KZ39_9EUKA|nr:hypothetical protein TRFO_14821 [Tritrichomonas foetus]|eukprot:OHT14853.1 hypothetical protein TRFO_14821 [Tritrichomonas foetus]
MFWDEFAKDEPAGSDMHTLISSATPDYDTILQNNELFPLLRQKDDDVLNFFKNPKTIGELIRITLGHENLKISKKVVELFSLKDSPILQVLINDQKLCESLISKIDSCDLLRIGFISRIFQNAANYFKADFLNLFNNSLEILTNLTKCINTTAVLDLVHEYLSLLNPDEQWLIFTYLQILLPKGKSATCPKCFLKFKNSIIGLIKNLAKFPLDSFKKANIIRLMINLFKEPNTNSEVIASISPMLAFIFESSESTEIKILILELSLIIPPEKSILNIAAKIIQKTGSKYDQLSVTALDLLAKSPSKTLLILLPTIVNAFKDDRNNSFHHLSFVNFIKAAISVPELTESIVEQLKPLILNGAGSNASIRKNATCSGFFLQLAEVIDSHIKGNDGEWTTFRSTQLSKWQELSKLQVEAPKPVATSSAAKPSASSQTKAVPNKPSETPSPVKVEKEDKRKQVNVGEEVAVNATGISFPTMDSFPEEKKEGDAGFSFPPAEAFPASNNDEFAGGGFDFPPADAFGKTGESETNNGSFNFPPADAFPTVNDENKSDFAFPPADAFGKTDENEGENKDEGFGFPPVDAFPAAADESKSDFTFPPADAFGKTDENEGENKDEGFGFPPVDAFPAAADESKSDFTFPPADAFGKTTNENQTSNGNSFGFPPADAFPTVNEESNNEFSFPPADAFGKTEEESKNDISFPTADSFPAAFPTDAFPNEKNEEESGGFSFPPADTFGKAGDDESAKTEQAGAFVKVDENENKDDQKDEDEKKDENDEDEEEDDDDSFEEVKQAPAIDITKPIAPIPVISAKPVSNEPVDVSFAHFLELIDNPCWEYSGPTPAELFGQKDAFSTVEEAFNFLVGKS